jgi:hypothetical protein
MKTITKAGLKIRANIKAGGLGGNHNRAGLRVKAAMKAGGLGGNHNRSALRIRSGVTAGFSLVQNHSRLMFAAS